MKYIKKCSNCGQVIETYRNPFPTVDVVTFVPPFSVVLIKRKNKPFGWALPGGFVDYGESVESAALREVKEETGLDVSLLYLLGVYSDPKRDPRFHTLSTVFVGIPLDLSQLKAGDDADKARIFSLNQLPNLVFDHAKILQDFCYKMKISEDIKC
ncbi:8-oxo-dGTP diphosphatase [Desulfonauticus submarinus]|uniref:8-oxo-dGTP diphosphatase n=1 Tax=Desulfonauticus submarinus TaxID=206665 RepID=A0A1H0E8Y2_9BACT|nr:NUDIX hydrolase [Desulfonauticus submarinus]SDN78845.1 8-oxo-dGTP diphosphatase [Desulfonauticus submarinus]